MAQNIKVTQEIKDKLLKEFAAQLDKFKAIDSKISLTQELSKVTDKRVIVIVTPKALYKMYALVFNYGSEIAWHGLVSRPEQNKFIIEDILVYPQHVASATVETDQEEYTKWLMSLPPETIGKMRFQGHSHVNMQCSPSAVDLNHQKQIVGQLGDDDYYIFAILNKNMNINYWVYDMVSNLKYEMSDIDLLYVDEQTELEVDQMLDWCDKNVTKKAYQQPVVSKTDPKPSAPKAVKTEQKQKDVKPAKKTKKKDLQVMPRYTYYSSDPGSWGKYADETLQRYARFLDDEDW